MSKYDNIVVNWFPGHMAKATRIIKEKITNVHHIIEVPSSSLNPVLQDIIFSSKKKHTILFTKNDLANPSMSIAWKSHFNGHGVLESRSSPRSTRAKPTSIFLSLKGLLQHSGQWKSSERRPFTELVQHLHDQAPHGANSPNICMVVGLPNVGKSTLINQLIGRKSASVAPKPAWTRCMQLFRIKSQPMHGESPQQHGRNAGKNIIMTPRKVELPPPRFNAIPSDTDHNHSQTPASKNRMHPLWIFDSPGIMIPQRIESEQGLRLALCGCLADQLIDNSYVVMGDYLFDLLKVQPSYPINAQQWYHGLGFSKTYQLPQFYEQFLRDLGILFGKREEMAQAQIFVNHFRSGELGRYTLDGAPPSSP